MKTRLNLIMAFAVSALTAVAAEVNITAGGLQAAIGENTTVTTLTVSGEMDASDFDFIGQEMKELTTLNLTNAKIVAYSGEGKIMGQTDFASDVLPAYSLMGSKISTIALPATLVEIGEAALSSTQLTAITIPASVKTIGMGAFSNCDQLTAIEIPVTVTTMASHAFMGCDKLESVKVGDGISVINDYTFARCVALTEVKLPSTLKTIGNSAFNSCVSVKEISFPATLVAIGDYTFQSTGLTSVNLSENATMTSIGEWAFANCTELSSVALNDNISTIGKGAFFDDPKLVEFNMPASCQEVKEYVFKGTSAIDTSKVVHQGVTTIGAYAMTGWNHVTTFTLPMSLAYIGDNAFEGWSSLERLNADKLNVVPELGANVWEGVDQPSATLTVSNPLYADFIAAEQWNEFQISQPSSVEEIIADGATSVKAYFTGDNLTVKATADIVNLQIYDSSGRQYVHSVPQTTETVIETGEWDCRIYIVKAMLVDGTSATMKIARR